MKCLTYRVNNWRWKDGYVQKKGLLFWRNVCLCHEWIDAVWAINCIAGLRDRSTFR